LLTCSGSGQRTGILETLRARGRGTRIGIVCLAVGVENEYLSASGEIDFDPPRNLGKVGEDLALLNNSRTCVTSKGVPLVRLKEE
jgi:hypothetical protein